MTHLVDLNKRLQNVNHDPIVRPTVLGSKVKMYQIWLFLKTFLVPQITCNDHEHKGYVWAIVGVYRVCSIRSQVLSWGQGGQKR